MLDRVSRHMLMCCVAKKDSVPHNEYIDRRKENMFFMHA